MGGVIYTSARERSFWDAVTACVLLRKNFQNGVLARSITKIPLVLPIIFCLLNHSGHNVFTPKQKYANIKRT
jgi:hypothetical protein